MQRDKWSLEEGRDFRDAKIDILVKNNGKYKEVLKKREEEFRTLKGKCLGKKKKWRKEKELLEQKLKDEINLRDAKIAKLEDKIDKIKKACL